MTGGSLLFSPFFFSFIYSLLFFYFFITTLQSHRALDGLGFLPRRFRYLSL